MATRTVADVFGEQKFEFDREKYLAIARSESPQAALTALHKDLTLWEVDTFEGPKGWQPEQWREVDGARALSRELWELALRA